MVVLDFLEKYSFFRVSEETLPPRDEAIASLIATVPGTIMGLGGDSFSPRAQLNALCHGLKLKLLLELALYF